VESRDNVIGSDRYANAFDRSIPAVLEVDSGSTVTFETVGDVVARLAAGEPIEQIGFENLNPVTGPLYVRGAEPGDALRIRVLDIEIHRVWSIWLPQVGFLGGYAAGFQSLELPIEGDRIRIGEQLSVPLAPMIGCIGLAPATGSASTIRPLRRTGGNMDLREVSPGSTVWLPVEVPGALLSLGDVHAAMGNGEPTNMALEAVGAATVQVDVERASRLRSPRVRVGNETICVGMGESHLDAKQDAIVQSFELLTGEHGLEPFAAFAYASARVGLRFAGPSGTMVDGLQAVLAAVPDPG
jgi:amidase